MLDDLWKIQIDNVNVTSSGSSSTSNVASSSTSSLGTTGSKVSSQESSSTRSLSSSSQSISSACSIRFACYFQPCTTIKFTSVLSIDHFEIKKISGSIGRWNFRGFQFKHLLLSCLLRSYSKYSVFS